MAYDSRWFKGLSKEDKERRIKELNSAQWAFRMLEDVLKSERKTIPTDYDISNWACKAAHANGSNQTLDSVLHLIKQKD